jgi:hypothetical protein
MKNEMLCVSEIINENNHKPVPVTVKTNSTSLDAGCPQQRTILTAVVITTH